ncbi:TonB-dependent receptor [Sphingobium sp. EM0848]|uniref:TonB-dependent receptor n=1 Tax=Sphingobium sp. EM0848 TaxID=2743473 RepID=UPI00159CAB66|nr:TonB-dependent receptor [Sphingobium sp. EM0848]
MKRAVIRASLLVASSIYSISVQAQADNNGANRDGDIIVTAQKRSERLQDVPLSITAVTGDQLGKQGISSAADLEKIAPGFTYRQSQNGTPVFAIRGIGFYSEQVANAPTVTIYTDQIPLPYARMAEGAALDVERVEVLKGPQGTLFGQNSTGGAINYVAAKPTDHFTGGFSLTYGRFNQFDAEGYVSGPIAEGLTFRLAARHESRDDWQKSSTRDDKSGQHNFTVGRLLVDWEPSDRLHVELNINGWRDRSDTQQSQARGYLPVSETPPATPQTIATNAALTAYPYITSNDNRLADWDPGRDYRRDDEFYQVAANIRYDVSDEIRLISISSYSHLKSFAPIDVDGTDHHALFLTQDGLIKTFTQELRLEGDMGRFKWVFGGNYEHHTANELQRTDLRGSNSQLVFGPGVAVQFDGLDLYNDQKINAKAVFGNVDFKLTDQLSVQGGIRYAKEDRDFKGCLADNGTPTGFGAVLGLPLTAPNRCVTFLPSGAPGQVVTSLNQDNVSWRVSLNYKPSSDALLYANVTKGYKSGGFGTLPAVSYQQLQPVTQESVLAYEAGFKFSLFDRVLDLSGAAFYDDYRDKQTQGSVIVPPFGNLPYLVNVPKSRIYGFELDATLRPVTGLRITAGGTYLNTRVKSPAPVASPFGEPVDAGGERLPNAPKWQIQGDAEYDFAINKDLSAFLGGSISFRTSSDAALGARTGPAGSEDWFKIDGYTLLDLRAGLEFGNGYRVQIWGKNVTNKGYWNNVVHIYDTYARITGQPATYGVTVSAKF